MVTDAKRPRRREPPARLGEGPEHAGRRSGSGRRLGTPATRAASNGNEASACRLDAASNTLRDAAMTRSGNRRPTLTRVFGPGSIAGRLGCCALLALAVTAKPARADELTVAVAANFLTVLRALEPEFESATGHELALAPGSTGQLYGQIVNGAPFDVLLAADQERPRLLAEQGLGDPASVFTYAIGSLVLWSREPGRVGDDTLAALPDEEFRWLAIAEPAVAPYGAAAKQALERLGVWRALGSRLVRGQNVAQTFAMVETGNADLGLVALSQALAYAGPSSYRVVPPELHEPIRQDAVLLRRAAANRAARAFLDYLGTPAAAGIIERYGYAVAGPAEPAE